MQPQPTRTHAEDQDRFYVRLGMTLLAALAVAFFAAIFVDPAKYSAANPELCRLVQKVRVFDGRVFLQPVAKHPVIALLLALLAAYSANLYALANNRFKSPNSRLNCLFYAPLAIMGVAAAVFSSLRICGFMEDRIPGDHGAFFWAWAMICGIGAAGACNLYTLIATMQTSLSIRRITQTPSVFDLEDLSGAASPRDLPGLLIRFGAHWPDPSNDAVRKKLQGRLCLGRYYEAKTPTNLWVAPEITRLNQTVVVAPPGSGKTFSIALPWTRDIPEKGHSVFLLDLKGNMYSKLSRSPRSRVLYFDPTAPGLSLHWNPFEELSFLDPLAFRHGRDSLAEALFGEVTHGENQFFDLRDLRLIKAGIDICAQFFPNPTLEQLHSLFLDQDRLFAMLSALQEPKKAAELRQRCGGEHEKAEYNYQAALKAQKAAAADLLLLSDTTQQKHQSYSELVQGVRNKLDPYGHIALAALTDRSYIPHYGVNPDGTLQRDKSNKPVVKSETPFHLSDITQQPTSFVFSIPLELGVMGHGIAAVVVRLLQHHMHSRYRQAADNPGIRRLFLVLDEFSKLRMSYAQTEDFISTSREAACVSVIFLQDVSQIREDIRQSILANCLDRYFLRGAGPATAGWCSASLGKRRAPRQSMSENASTGGAHRSEGKGTSISEEYVPVLREREIQTTGGLRFGAWVVLNSYSHKPILVNLERPVHGSVGPASSWWRKWLP